MKKALEAAKEKGLKRLEAETVVENVPAVRLLKKFGFKIEGVKKKAFLTDDGRYIDLYLFAKLLS